MESTANILRLRSLPISERRDELESIVASVFKITLLMDDDEPISLSESFFDMGLTSLGLTEAKQRLETWLDCNISSTSLFNSPTIEQLTDYLMEQVLGDLFDGSGIESQAGSSRHPNVQETASRNALWDDVMRTCIGNENQA